MAALSNAAEHLLLGGRTYIYCLYNPSNMEVRYVGKTINPVERFKNHISDAKRLNKYPVHKWINKLIKSNIEPKMQVIDFTDLESEWEQAEKDYITFFRWLNKTKNKTLLNITDGGEGTLGKKVSQETKDKIRNSLKGRKRSLETIEKMSIALKGKVSSQEVIEKRRQGQLGHKVSEETRELISKANKGRKMSEEFCENISQKLKGREPWNKGTVGEQVAWNKGLKRIKRKQVQTINN